MTNRRTVQARQVWLLSVEREVITARPKMAGRMDWDTATYLYNRGIDAETAAAKLIALADKECA